MKVTIAKKETLNETTKVLKEEFFDSISKAKNYVAKKIKSQECFIISDKGTIIGVLIYTRNYSHYANYIEYISVSKKHRGKGIAKLLLKKYVAISRKEQPRKQKYALSSTHKTNIVSIKMHMKFGFKKLGVIKHLHYGKDEIIFGYPLH